MSACSSASWAASGGIGRGSISLSKGDTCHPRSPSQA